MERLYKAGLFSVIFILKLMFAKGNNSISDKAVYWEEPKSQTVKEGLSDSLHIFCYRHRNGPSLYSLWKTVNFYIISDAEYTVHKKPTADEVVEDHVNYASFWNNLKPWRSDHISVSPFNDTCIGVKSQSGYTVRLIVKNVDYWLISYLCAGLFLFFLAPPLSRNILFYYGTGISFGLFASVLIIIFIISRFIPKKTGAYVFLTAGVSMSAYLFQVLCTHTMFILQEYYHYVFSYFVVAGLVSFAVCYYKGPVSNPRIHSLIQWSIQALGLGLLFWSTTVPEVSHTLMALAVVKHNLPSCGFRTRVALFWRRMFPHKRRLLTEAEYNQEGQVETARALEELKAYCRSPQCDVWRTIGRLKTPDKFASFVRGDSFHVDDDEFMAYEENPSPRRLFDDDDVTRVDQRDSQRYASQHRDTRQRDAQLRRDDGQQNNSRRGYGDSGDEGN